MEVSFEVLVSTNIKRKKPSPKLCWLGKQKEAVFLHDDKYLSELNLQSGRVKKAPPRLQAVLKKKSIVTLSTSLNGIYVAGLLLSGELFIWNKDLDSLQTVPANEEVTNLIAAVQELSLKLYLFISGDGKKVLLVTLTGSVFLWESTERDTLLISSKCPTLSRWTKIQPCDSALFPGTTDKDATVNAIFVKNEILGDSLLCSFAFYSGQRLVMTFLTLRWYEDDQRCISSLPYHIRWAQQECSVQNLVPSCQAVKSRGALVATFSRDGLVLALTVNQRDPKDTQILFINSMNFTTISGHLRGCSSKDQNIPSKLLRSYWVGDMSWTADSLFLACLLKRGTLVLLTRLGEILTLTTFGCSVEFGPAEFIPLHPLITYRSPWTLLDSQDANNSLGSCASDADIMRQRYSVTCHPRLPYLIVSDGYMVTALRIANNLTPYSFVKSLLLDSAQRLENMRQTMELGKPKNNGIKLRPLSSLKAHLLKDHGTAYAASSTIPGFLQAEEENVQSVELSTIQDEEEDSDDDFPRYSVPCDSFGHAEQGKLEFASMFDTIHAREMNDGQNAISSDIHLIQRSLHTAWTVCVTMRHLEEKESLLQYTVGCLSHFLSVLQSFYCTSVKSDTLSKRKGNVCIVFLRVFQQCLTVLHWDVISPMSFKHIVKLTTETTKMILAQQDQLYTRRLLQSVCLLKMVSQQLNAIYHHQYETLSISPTGSIKAILDILYTPAFEMVDQPPKGFSACSIVKQPPESVKLSMKSEKRLAVLWRLLYNRSLCYQSYLRQHISSNPTEKITNKVNCEQQAVTSLICHIQAELQAAGQGLDQSLHLLPVTGEECFLLGSYKESVDYWRRALVDISTQGGRRASLLQTRYYLSLLYCHLYNYNLNDAQGMCDQLVGELLRKSNLLTEAPEDLEQQLFDDLHPEAALAVIQSMGRFMAAYFTNQQLYVFPPHNVHILLPLYGASERHPRVVALQHSMVASVVRDQNLSCVWTVEYALDLLLVGGLVPEAVWLANKLGDWKMSVSMGVAYNLYIESIPDESERKELSLPPTLTPAHIFQEKLQAFLGRPPSLTAAPKDGNISKEFTDPIEEEDADLLFSSVQEMLKAAIMADAEILTETLHQLMDSAKELSRRLADLVPDKLYLPAPPLYCPQPASVSEDDHRDLQFEAEKHTRQKLSGVLQRILLILRAAHCSVPAAQWYIKQLKRARKFLQKIRAKCSLPPLNALPESLLNYSNSSKVFFKASDQQKDHISASIVGCFRELCALCWMLHVRERLSFSCRQYQKARDNGKLFKSADDYDACVTERCFEALDWACRMLPFTRIINCEELIQDIILSLVSELPPVRKVAEILVKAFPHPEDVRVQLREKYQSVQQRLRHSTVKGPHGEEMMSVVIHNVQRVRLKMLKRIQRNIGPVEMHVWESVFGDTSDEEVQCYDQLSLGTSLSRSTITDLARPQVYSDADTLSEAFTLHDSDERSERHIAKGSFVKRPRQRKPDKEQKAEESTDNVTIFPTVGTWEFECEDEEYITFLELFLSYLLEKDLHCSEPGIPFLSTFCNQLRENELNCLVFDVHTTLKRRLGKAKIQSVFRAGCSYAVNKEPWNDSDMLQGTSLSQDNKTSDFIPKFSSTVILDKPKDTSNKLFCKSKMSHSGKRGLFGLKEQRKAKYDKEVSDVSVNVPAHNSYHYRVIHTGHFKPSEELGMELKAKFGNEEKLVEWMIRWSDRRLFWTAGKAELFQAHSSAIRVKATSAAILTSIWLLEKPYLGGVFKQNERTKVPPQEFIVAPTFQEVVESELQEDSSLHVSHLQTETDSVPAMDGPDQVLTEQNLSSASSNVTSISKESRSKRDHITATKGLYADYHKPTVDAIVHLDEIPSETEEEQDDQLDTQRSPNISVSIRTTKHHMEKLPSDVDIIIQEPEAQNQPLNGRSERAEPALFSDIAPADPQTLSSAASVPPVETSTAQQTLHGGDQGASNTSEAVRQLFQDEMFRLLQLQQINFMSLMQVVGSSFAALPGLHQVLQQTAQIGRSQMGHAVEEHFTPQSQTALPTQVPPSNSHPAVQRQPDLGVENPDKQCSASDREKNAGELQGNKENIQTLPELSIPLRQVRSGEETPANPRVPTAEPNPSLPLLSFPVVQMSPTHHPTPRVLTDLNGLPLLKLQPEPKFLPLHLISNHSAQELTRPRVAAPREAWVLPTRRMRDEVQVYQHHHHNKGKAMKRGEDRNRKWPETIHKGHSAPMSVNQAHPQAGVTAHLLNQKRQGKETRQQDITWRQQKVGIPLLQLKPCFPPIFTPDIRVSSHLKAKSDHGAALPQAPITLLKANLPQNPECFPMSLTPQLIPLKNVTEYERSIKQDLRATRGGALQLLQANIEPFEEVVKLGDSIKRQKRRSRKQKDEKADAKKERKASVTFRPEDSIISPNNLDEVAQAKDVKEDEPIPEEENPFVLPLGSFESLLSKPTPVSSIPTVAELHYIASTRKRPPEVHDASTNTESAAKPYKDAGTECNELPCEFPNSPTAASNSAAGSRLPVIDPPIEVPPPSDVLMQLPPELFLNLQFPLEKLDERIPLRQTSDVPPTCVGHHYISVTDLEGDDFPDDFSEETRRGAAPAEKVVHIVDSTPSEAPLGPVQIRDHVRENRQEQRLGDQVIRVADPVTYEMLSNKAAPYEKFVRRPWTSGTVQHQALSRLQEMDAQLAALQEMANGMERDFANTALLVKTIETLADASEPNPDIAVHSSRRADMKAHAPRMEIEKIREEEELTLTDIAGVDSFARPPVVCISWEDLPYEARPSTGPAENRRVDKSAGQDDLLHVTGLSDIADILNDLMKGGVSASELGLTETQTSSLSRVRARSASSMPGSKRTEKERLELQNWMKKKQRERLSEHKRQLEELRAMEHKPYQSTQDANTSVSSRTIQRHQRLKEERDKSLLSEHHDHRVSEALGLMQEMLSEAKHVPAIHPRSNPSASKWQTQLLSPRGPSAATRSSPASHTARHRPLSKTVAPRQRPMSTPSRLQSRGTATFVKQRSTSDPKSRARSAPSYPVHFKFDKALPGDRLSQVTRRGLLTAKNKPRVQGGTTTVARHPGSAQERRGGSSFQTRRNQTEDEDLELEMERDLVSPWEIPEEIRNILKRSTTFSQGSLNGDGSSRNVSKVDGLSESTSSLLSKLDWNAIEDMVAGVDET
ncbi:ciliogenesis and planar polarity effector 1 isoform X2 [Xenopus laevis]|uniref:Ciliogenesis and planar polarity effector 1 isoform X2 n=1 Tax=Xenopus laevis TaxID=8355 RepID=A0A8J0VEG4_XENLA|nr:ciliogenesis and planar polarity effector 1 isoform X2 [Xenopus laevis]